MEKKYQIMKNINHGIVMNFQEKHIELDNKNNMKYIENLIKKNQIYLKRQGEEISNKFVNKKWK